MFSRALGGLLIVLAAAPCLAARDTGIYVGTTPCDAVVREFLEIPKRAKCELIRWDLWMALGVNGFPNRLVITADYGIDGSRLEKIKREGDWSVGLGTPEHPDGRVYRLSLGKRELRLWQVGPNTLQFLDPTERTLLVGNGAWSYTLATATASKPRSAAEPPDMTYRITPPATGPTVFGVFEGRTPCDLGQVIGVAVPAGCIKLKWRATLFQDADTRALTHYRLEGSLFRDGPREGAITRAVSTSFNQDATVLVLEPPAAGRPVYLMRGDDNVFFFVDKEGNLGVGNREFNFALNRRPES